MKYVVVSDDSAFDDAEAAFDSIESRQFPSRCRVHALGKELFHPEPTVNLSCHRILKLIPEPVLRCAAGAVAASSTKSEDR
jgi:hypothetical protein